MAGTSRHGIYILRMGNGSTRKVIRMINTEKSISCVIRIAAVKYHFPTMMRAVA